MAQNITLLGASYSDVPAVDLPKTGGGMARFTDVSDTTVTAAEVPTGKYFYDANGVRTEGEMADYVKSQGTSGIWEYVIWNSGKAECWGTTSNITVNVTTGWGNMYTTSSAQPTTTQNYPTNLFSSVSYARADWVGYNGDMLTCEDNNSGSVTAPPKVYPVSPQSKSSHQGHIRYYARGTVSANF